MEAVATDQEVQSVIRPETESKTVKVGGRTVDIIPMVYRWQALFWPVAMDLLEAELGPVERITEMARDGLYTGTTASAEMFRGARDYVEKLGHTAAIVLASQIPGAEKAVGKVIAEQEEWLGDHSNFDELRTLVSAQMEAEKLATRVGELLPAKYVEALGNRLAGTPKNDSQNPVSTSSSLNSPEPTGDGN